MENGADTPLPPLPATAACWLEADPHLLLDLVQRPRLACRQPATGRPRLELLYASGPNDDVILYEDDLRIIKLTQPLTNLTAEPTFNVTTTCAPQ